MSETIVVIIYLVSELEMIVEWLGVQKCLVDTLPIFCDRLCGMSIINRLQCSIHRHQLHDVVYFLFEKTRNGALSNNPGRLLSTEPTSLPSNPIYGFPLNVLWPEPLLCF